MPFKAYHAGAWRYGVPGQKVTTAINGSELPRSRDRIGADGGRGPYARSKPYSRSALSTRMRRRVASSGTQTAI